MIALAVMGVAFGFGALVSCAGLFMQVLYLQSDVAYLRDRLRIYEEYGTPNKGESMHSLMNFVMKRQDALVDNHNARVDAMMLVSGPQDDGYGAN